MKFFGIRKAADIFNEYIEGSYSEMSSLIDLLEMLNPGFELDFQKKIYEPNHSVDPENTTPFAIEIDDLSRLHYIVTRYKRTTVLEFGIGYSTLVMADAIDKNSVTNGEINKYGLRRNDLWTVNSVDSDQSFIELSINRIPKSLRKYVKARFSPVQMATFNSRICTYYNNIPNVSPDFIYLDGPDQFVGVREDVRGVSTRHPDRMPMAADILALEHFILPGTIIVVDGRTANARFLAANLQRDWDYHHYEDMDISVFVLRETPLGVYNKRQIVYQWSDNTQ